MNIAMTALSSAALGFAMSAANAQQPPASAPSATAAPVAETAAPVAKPKPPKATAQSEAGEPRANTTAQSEAGEPRANTSRPPPGPAPSQAVRGTAPGPAPKGPASADRLELGTATVTGDREQPKVMYIVPWKKSDIGDLAGKPMNSLVDEILAPVDRDVFKREVVYYKAVQADASQNGAPGHPSQQGEK
jgi:hypothetical protein